MLRNDYNMDSNLYDNIVVGGMCMDDETIYLARSMKCPERIVNYA